MRTSADKRALYALLAATAIIGTILIASLASGSASKASSTSTSAPISASTSEASTSSITSTSNTTSSTLSGSVTPTSTKYPAYGVATTIPIGYTPGTPLFDSDNGDIYVRTNSQISVISGSSNTVIANVTAGYGQVQAAFDSENGDIYVSSELIGPGPLQRTIPPASLIGISGETNTVVANVTLPGSRETGAAPVFDPVNGDIYLSTPNNRTGTPGILWVVSGATNQVVETMSATLTTPPFFDSLNGDLYLSNDNNANVSVISSATNTIVATLPVFSFHSPALDTANGDLYFPSGTSSLAIFSGATNSLIENISLAQASSAPVYDPVNGDVYLPSGDDLYVISGATNTVLTVLNIGDNPQTPCVILTTGDVAVPELAGDTIDIVSGADNAIINSFRVGEGPLTPLFDSDNGNIYVSNNNTGSVSPGMISVITSGGPSVTSQSSDGLTLTISLNASGIQSGQGLAIAVDEANPAPKVSTVTSSSNWPGVSGTFASGPCGVQDYPMGWAMARGYIAENNLSAAQWLSLYEPGQIDCPPVLSGPTAYIFQPSSNNVAFQGTVGAPCSTFPQGCGPVPSYATGSFNGFINGSNFDAFSPGVYTVVAADEWGTLAFLHLTVVEAPPAIEVVSVGGPVPPYNPGGPVVDITLKNIGQTPIASLNATLGVPSPLSVPYTFVFNVSPSSPLLPGQSTQQELNLIDAGFGSNQEYPLTISGVLLYGPHFSYTIQVQVVAPG